MVGVTWSQLLLKIFGTRGYSDLGGHCGEPNRGADEDTHSLVFQPHVGTCTRSFVAMLVPTRIADHLILVSRDVRLRSFIDQIEQNGNICFARSQGSKIPRHKAAKIFSKRDAKLSGLSSGLT